MYIEGNIVMCVRRIPSSIIENRMKYSMGAQESQPVSCGPRTDLFVLAGRTSTLKQMAGYDSLLPH